MIVNQLISKNFLSTLYVLALTLPLSQVNFAAENKAEPSTISAGTERNWPNHGGGFDESNFSQLDSINGSTIDELALAWSLDLPGEVTLQATPVAVDGVLYFSGTYSAVYAVDAKTGKLLWKHDPEIWKHGSDRMRLQFAVNRGVAYSEGRIFSATFDGRLLALDAATGKLLWSVMTVPPSSYYFITGAPRIVKDMVIIGNGGGDYGARGYLTAYKIDSGKQAWRFYVVPGSPEENKGDPIMEKAAATWTGEYWKTGTGGGPWSALTYDPELNQVYIGTGNGGPSNPALRSPGGGDNLFLVSIVAVDADTGEYRWHYQQNPLEAWDYKATADMIATTLNIDGQSRKVLMQAPVNGFFYVLDRETGELISAEKFSKVTWAEGIDLKTGRPIEANNIRFETGELKLWPGPAGAHNWQAMSYSPNTGLVYIPHQQGGVSYNQGKAKKGEIPIAGLNIGWIKEEPDDLTGSLLAWDPVKQQRAWNHPLDSFWNGGTLATAGNLVFQGTADGYLHGYNATTGERVWSFNAVQGIQGAPISFAVDGVQYISVLVGYGGSASAGGEPLREGWKYGQQPRRVLTFALNGKAALPDTPPQNFTLNALDDPSIKLNEADIEAGRLLYVANFCIVCHGRDLGTGGTAPDLRESAIALNFDSFWSVVHKGALLPRGMPKFDDLTEQEAKQIQAYIRAGAREALGTRKPSGKASSMGRF